MTANETYTARPSLIRARRETDRPACFAVLQLVHDHDSYPVVWPPDPETWATGPGALAAWVAEGGGTVVGHVCLRPASGPPIAVWQAATGLPSERLGVISRLFVHPGHRRSGIGRQLLRITGVEARRRGLQPVLDVLLRNQDACRLYEAEGWRRCGEFEWEMPDGSVEPAYAYVLA